MFTDCCVSGRHLVAGHHGHRAGEGRAAALGAAPHEGSLPHPKEQPANAGGQLQQTAQGVCGGLPQQGAQLCERPHLLLLLPCSPLTRWLAPGPRLCPHRGRLPKSCSSISSSFATRKRPPTWRSWWTSTRGGRRSSPGPPSPAPMSPTRKSAGQLRPFWRQRPRGSYNSVQQNWGRKGFTDGVAVSQTAWRVFIKNNFFSSLVRPHKILNYRSA